MFYRLTIDVGIDSSTDLNTVVNAIKSYKSKFKEHYQNPNNPTIVVMKSVKYHTCHHDETPPIPCENYVEVDLT